MTDARLFPVEFSREQKLAAVTRELTFRRRVYARHVAAGKMKQATADFQIAVFEAIAFDYRPKDSSS